MKPKAKLSWWVIPSVITGSLAMLGGLGTCAVKYATYESLPSKVEAAQQKNVEQDQAIDKLTTINETWQQIYQQQQQQVPNQPAPQGFEWRQDDQGTWYCQGAETWWWPDPQTGRCR